MILHPKPVSWPERTNVASVVMRLVQAADFLLLLLSGLLAKIVLLSKQKWLFDGQLFLATLAGSVIATYLLARSKGYSPRSLCSLGEQFRLLLKPLLLSMGGVIVCISPMRDDAQFFRRWPIVWFGLSFALDIVSNRNRCPHRSPRMCNSGANN